jgi:choline dehydrogenase
VVDTDCRVHGLANLRIVDASIFPSIPQAMTNAAVIAVAERASDIILGRAVDAMSPSKSKEAHNVSEQAAD